MQSGIRKDSKKFAENLLKKWQRGQFYRTILVTKICKERQKERKRRRRKEKIRRKIDDVVFSFEKKNGGIRHR